MAEINWRRAEDHPEEFGDGEGLLVVLRQPARWADGTTDTRLHAVWIWPNDGGLPDLIYTSPTDESGWYYSWKNVEFYVPLDEVLATAPPSKE